MDEREINESDGKKEDIQNDKSEIPVKSPLFPCYLCGKNFRVPEIYDHEEDCLKLWKEENEKLPPHKRKQLPQKEDIKFTPSGEVDFEGTFKRIWENHLAELVPCKRGGRTFAPDRLEIHENSCKGEKGRKKYEPKPSKKS